MISYFFLFLLLSLALSSFTLLSLSLVICADRESATPHEDPPSPSLRFARLFFPSIRGPVSRSKKILLSFLLGFPSLVFCCLRVHGFEMRLSLRIGLAAALIIFALVLINRQLHTVGQAPQSFWHFDTTSFRASLRQPQQTTQDGIHRKWGGGSKKLLGLTYQTTPIEVPNAGVIVMGKLREENTAWVSAEVAEYVPDFFFYSTVIFSYLNAPWCFFSRSGGMHPV